MVLSHDKAKVAAQEIQSNPIGYLVLKTERFRYSEDTTRLKFSLELLNCIHLVNQLNKSLEKLGSEKRVSSKIFYEGIESIMVGSYFSDRQMGEYLLELQNMQLIARSLSNLMDTDFHISFTVEFMLLGINPSDLNYDHVQLANLQEEYGEIWSAAIDNEISVMEYVSKARKLVKDFPCKE